MRAILSAGELPAPRSDVVHVALRRRELAQGTDRRHRTRRRGARRRAGTVSRSRAMAVDTRTHCDSRAHAALMIMTGQIDELTVLAASGGRQSRYDGFDRRGHARDRRHAPVQRNAAHGERGDVIPIAATQDTLGRIAYTQKEPIGVVVAVSAFNHPLNLIVHQVGAGRGQRAARSSSSRPNDTPLSCLKIRRAAARGRPARRLVPGDRHRTAARLPNDSSPIRASRSSASSAARRSAGCCARSSRRARGAHWNTAASHR